MKQITVLILMVFLMMVAGCSVNSSKIDDDYATDFASNLTYVKDHRTGLCYAIVASRRTGNPDQTGIGITLVPCDSVAKLLVNP